MKLIDGFWFPDDDKHFAKHAPLANYQRPQYDAALSYCKRRHMALDIGAHVGLFTRRMLHDFDCVLPIEPMPETFKCLVRNINETNLTRDAECTPINAAAGRKTGLKKMHDLPCGWAFFADDGDIPIRPYRDVPTVEVEVIALDDRVHGAGPDLVKIDVQGAEAAVVEGASRTLTHCRPVVLIEEKPLGKTDWRGVENVRSMLTDLGYRLIKRIGADAIYVHPNA